MRRWLPQQLQLQVLQQTPLCSRRVLGQLGITGVHLNGEMQRIAMLFWRVALVDTEPHRCLSRVRSAGVVRCVCAGSVR